MREATKAKLFLLAATGLLLSVLTVFFGSTFFASTSTDLRSDRLLEFGSYFVGRCLSCLVFCRLNVGLLLVPITKLRSWGKAGGLLAY
jgi:hypothetical protein